MLTGTHRLAMNQLCCSLLIGCMRIERSPTTATGSKRAKCVFHSAMPATMAAHVEMTAAPIAISSGVGIVFALFLEVENGLSVTTCTYNKFTYWRKTCG